MYTREVLDEEREETALTPLEIEAIVREKNQITIPRLIADRHGIEPGKRLVMTDTGAGEFTVRVLPTTYAGTLDEVYGKSMEEHVDYVRRERADWA